MKSHLLDHLSWVLAMVLTIHVVGLAQNATPNVSAALPRPDGVEPVGREDVRHAPRIVEHPGLGAEAGNAG